MACFVRSAPCFQMPESARLPIIMIGPGTGIAPFRSFWQQRRLDMGDADREKAEKFGPMTLLVGCRHPKVELYRDETREMVSKRVLSNVYTAYSRVPGQPKRYVQHALLGHSEQVYRDLVLGGGHFYVCGDVSMAEDVSQTLRAIVQDEGNLDPEEADRLVARLQEESRYHEDIFGITLKTEEVTSRGRAEAMNRIGGASVT